MAWRPGVFVTVDVVVDETDSGVTVTAGAIQTIEGQPVVFIVVPGGFVAQPITVGAINNDRAEITAGLSEGVKYVAANSFILKSRSEEHTSELQSLMRISYAVFCLKKKTHIHYHKNNTEIQRTIKEKTLYR